MNRLRRSVSAWVLGSLALAGASGAFGASAATGASSTTRAAAGAPAAAVMEYRYRDTGAIPRRDDFQARVLALALDKTLATDGAYRVVRVVGAYSHLRTRNEVYEGKRLNVFAAPLLRDGALEPGPVNIAVPVSILGNLQGVRQLIVRADDLQRFAAITSVAQLRSLTAGQGRGWIDVDVLRHNGFHVDDSANLESLLPMLLNKRFDYLPMSATEAASLLARHPALARQLAVAPGPGLEYPLTTVFFVSGKQPKLADRLARGLTLARNDGSLDALLRQAFRDELRAAQSTAGRRFLLTNPFSLPTSP